MTEIHITMVVHSLSKEPAEFWANVNDPRIFLHLFLHSKKESVEAMCDDMAGERNVYYYPYHENRGLARSWNQGMITARQMGADVGMVANDDIRASFEDVWEIARTAQAHPECFMASGMGLDLTTGEHKDMLLALAAFNPIAFDRLQVNNRLFDEQFVPIYFEDLDLYHRAKLAGIPAICTPHTHIHHIGSATRKVVADETAFFKDFDTNKARYIAKWGGDGTRGSEVFTLPYNKEQA